MNRRLAGPFVGAGIAAMVTAAIADSPRPWLTNVPTAFWISEDGTIEISSVGWSRQEFEEMARKAASDTGDVPHPIFQPTEQISDFRPG